MGLNDLWKPLPTPTVLRFSEEEREATIRRTERKYEMNLINNGELWDFAQCACPTDSLWTTLISLGFLLKAAL